MASIKRPVILPYLVSLIVLGCTLLPAIYLAASTNDFQLVILKQDWYDLKLGYSYAQALPLLKSADQPLFVVNTSDVESYDWKGQIITLTLETTARLIKTLPPDEALKKHVLYMGKVKREHGWGNPIETALHLKGFLVKVNDEVIYGGVFLEPMSELAIRYPVIRPRMVEGKAVFCLLPVQLPFAGFDPLSTDGAAWDGAIAPEGKKLWDQFPPQMKRSIISIGVSQEATEFRNTMRAGKLREVMEQAGRLKIK